MNKSFSDCTDLEAFVLDIAVSVKSYYSIWLPGLLPGVIPEYREKSKPYVQKGLPTQFLNKGFGQN